MGNRGFVTSGWAEGAEAAGIAGLVSMFAAGGT